MENQLNIVAKSYDRGITLGRNEFDLYSDLPEYITNDTDYPIYQKAILADLDSHSGRKEIRDYLSPYPGMNFVDLGCSVNLVFRGYDKWPSLYHGVDISSKTIKLLKEVNIKQNLTVAALHNKKRYAF